MIKIYDFANAKIKFSFDEDPIYSGLNTDKFKVDINRPCFTTPYFSPHTFGMEIWQHKGGRVCYGLLSSEISHRKAIDTISLLVHYTKKNVKLYMNNILLEKNTIYEGLLQEYLNAVVEGAKSRIMKQEKLPSCNISFNYAANCAVGSSPHFFNMISEFVVELTFMYYKENFQNNFVDSCIEKIAQKFNFKI